MRRHRVPLPTSMAHNNLSHYDRQYYTVDYFNVGKEIEMYGRVFKLTDCDTFTRNFIAKMEKTVGQSSRIPRDPNTEERQKMLDSMEPLR